MSYPSMPPMDPFAVPEADVGAAPEVSQGPPQREEPSHPGQFEELPKRVSIIPIIYNIHVYKIIISMVGMNLKSS